MERSDLMLSIKSQNEVNEMEGKGMEKMVQDHEQRIIALEKSYGSLENKMQAVETGQMRVETTLLREFTEQKALLNKHLDEQTSQNRQLLEHSLGLKRDNNVNKWKLGMQIFGTGGLAVAAIYGLIQFFS